MVEAAAIAGADVRVCGLKTEWLENPLGLELAGPRLSWRLEGDRPGSGQSAYRIRVARDAATLDEGGADLWDSGRVASQQSLGLLYEGPPLGSRVRAWWTVDVWDETGALAFPASAAFWEMGLVAPEDWSAQWLAVETEVEAADREAGLPWIWDQEASAAPRRLRLAFDLPAPARASTLMAAARGRIAALACDGRAIEIAPPSPHAFARDGAIVRDLGPLAAGRHVLAAEVVMDARPRDRPWRGALGALARFELATGETSRLSSGREWRISQQETEGWASPAFDDSSWTSATPAPGRPFQAWPAGPGMRLRSCFEVARPVARARLYATALGAYEAFLNGRRVGDALLAPESTDFRRRILYQVHDVTALVREGSNVLGAHVGDGWYASVIAPGGRYAFGPPPRRFLAQLELTFADGMREVVATGPGWRSHASPVIGSEIYNGETCDGRRETPGWNAPGFDDTGWGEARAAAAPPARLVAQTSPPIRVTEILAARSVSEPRPGVFVFDFGQNFTGFCRIRVTGPAARKVTMRFAEILGPDGGVDQSNLRAARATDTYVLAGDPDGETFQPSFTYHGFRYVEVEGWPGRPRIGDVEGRVIHSDLPITGALRIDQPVVEQLWRNALWSQRSNFTGIPTDCPQRDERLGWLGDACVFWDAAAFDMDVCAFTQRFAGDMRDAQGASGGFSDYAPAAMRFNDQPAPGWADAGVVLPWTCWRRYGSTSIIEAHWEAMARYLAYIEAANPDGLWLENRGLDFGDWLALDAKAPGDPTTPKDLIGTAWWAHSTALAAEMAEATGRLEDADRLRGLGARIRTAFQRTYIAADGAIGNGSQTGYILALKFGLVPSALGAAAGRRLVDDIVRRGGVLSTGFLGTPFSLDVLADLGRADLVYDLLLRTEFPSWGYMVAKGATTIWERWNGDVGDVAMNSFNHYALGAVAGFLFRRIAGIDAAEPGFRRVRVRPVLDPRVQRAGADYESVMGLISTDWTWTPGERFDLDLSVPPNASAGVELPTTLGERIEAAPGAGVRREAGRHVIELGAGRHLLSVLP